MILFLGKRFDGIAALTLAVSCLLSAQVSDPAGHPAGTADAAGSTVVSYHDRWNMVSTPYVLANDSSHVVFPSAISSAYRYVAGYQNSPVLTPGTGYWLKFLADEDVTITGTDIPGITLNLVQNWNLIGSISSPVAVASIITDDTTLVLSPFFGFRYSDGYYEVDTIHPGYAYWVLTNHAASITLSETPAMEPVSRRAVNIQPTSELPPPPPIAEDLSGPVIPDAYFLDQSYPNPFNPSTTIRFELPAESRVTLTIHDMLGREVAILYDGVRSEGFHSYEWNAGDRASGMYFYKLTATNLAEPGEVYSTVRKMVLMR